MLQRTQYADEMVGIHCLGRIPDLSQDDTEIWEVSASRTKAL